MLAAGVMVTSSYAQNGVYGSDTDVEATREGMAEDSSPPIADSDLIGKPVLGREGQTLGIVQMVFTDPDSATRMLVIDSSGVMAKNARQVLVALNEMKPTPDGKALQSNLTQQLYDELPEYQEIS
jgi:hypothetical protein